MGKVWVKELTGGLDTRRLPETTPGGLLIKGENGHINSGGEFESRAAFVEAYTLPTGTVGLAADASGIIVFGSAADPGVPLGVTYQQLIKDAKVLAAVPSWDLFAGDVYAVGEFDDGTIVHFYDETEVTDWYDGRARASFRVVAGTGAGSAQLDGLTVDGVAIIGSAVAFDTDLATTAAAIASEINSHTSSPDYDATAVDNQVNIVAADAGAAANGRSVFFTVSGDLEVEPSGGLFLAGGADSAAFTPGTFVKTLGSKMNALSGSVWHFSGIDEPTQWTTDATGAGFFDLAKIVGSATDLMALASYRGLAAIFAENTIVTMFVDPDPDLVRETQVLENTGTVSPSSVTTFGDADVFYTDFSGERSLKSTDLSSNAVTADLGSPVDGLITAKLQEMTAEERRGVIGLINPVDKRAWVCFPDEIFVFSFFPNGKVSAWTTYLPVDSEGNTFTIEKAVIFGRRIYLRGGDKIYVYGGLDSSSTLTYDSTVAKCHLPYFDADNPTAEKAWQGWDAALTGTWAVYAAMQPTALSTRDAICTLTETTFNKDRIPFNGSCTHVSPQFESQGEGPHKISSVVLHFEGGEDD